MLSRSESLTKRKSSDILSSKTGPFERKRSCNDLTISHLAASESSQAMACECDLVVIGLANGIEAAQRICNVSLRFALSNRKAGSAIWIHSSIPPTEVHWCIARIAQRGLII